MPDQDAPVKLGPNQLFVQNLEFGTTFRVSKNAFLDMMDEEFGADLNGDGGKPRFKVLQGEPLPPRPKKQPGQTRTARNAERNNR